MVAMETRFLAHFLLSFKDVFQVVIDYNKSVEERAKHIFMQWDVSERDERSWRKLRALLVFLGVERAATAVEGKQLIL